MCHHPLILQFYCTVLLTKLLSLHIIASPSTEISVGFDSEVYTVEENDGTVLMCVIVEFPFDVQPFEVTVYSLSQTAQGKCSLSDA